MQPPFFGPFNSAFYYFLETSRLENAEKIFFSGFRDLSPIQLIESYWSALENFENNEDIYVFRSYLDQVLSFLAKIGYEQDILDMGGFSSGNFRIRKFIKASWPGLLKRFMTETSELELFNLLQYLIDINLEYPTIEIKNIGDNKKTVKFRRWLLKRQMLGIYSAIMLDLKENEVLHTPGCAKTLELFKRLAADTFENYAFLICYSTRGYVFAALEILKKAAKFKIKPLWHEEVVENLINQIRHIKNQFSDVGDFFYKTMGINIFTNYPKELEKYFKDNEDVLKKAAVDDLIDKLQSEVLTLNDLTDPEILKSERIDLPYNNRQIHLYSLDKIRQAIAAKIDDPAGFWEMCRRKFTCDRLKLIVVSLDNQYSMRAAYFFNIPAIKLDKEKPIETELCLLKKWGSTGGLFERDKHIRASFGGGYFLIHNGFGLAIDVGPDFLGHLTNFTDFDLMDINGVICTHPHYDHTAEFKRILMGIREYNRTAGFKRLYYLFPDPDDIEMMHPEKTREDFCINVFHSEHREITGEGEDIYYFPNNEWGRKHGIRVQLIQVKHNIYRDRIYDSKNKLKKELEERLKELKKNKKAPGKKRKGLKEVWKDLRKIRKDLKKIQKELQRIKNEYLTSFGKKLGAEGDRWWSYGLLVSPLIEERIEKNGEVKSSVKPITNILFSGDAEYQEGLFEKIAPEFKPELIVLNISSARIEDIIAVEPGKDSNTPSSPTKRNHLGYTGVLTLLSQLHEQYKVAVISDFFEAQSEVDSRLLITGSLMKDLTDGKNIPSKILASEPGIRFRWPKKGRLEIFCTNLCHINNKGFGTPIEGNIRQAKRSPYARKEPILMVCRDCEKYKRDIYEIDKIWYT
jgi:ribonuclease BN (tRNA processing enzyme)